MCTSHSHQTHEIIGCICHQYIKTCHQSAHDDSGYRVISTPDVGRTGDTISVSFCESSGFPNDATCSYGAAATRRRPYPPCCPWQRLFFYAALTRRMAVRGQALSVLLTPTMVNEMSENETRSLGRMASHGKQTDEKRSRDVRVKEEEA